MLTYTVILDYPDGITYIPCVTHRSAQSVFLVWRAKLRDGIIPGDTSVEIRTVRV